MSNGFILRHSSEILSIITAMLLNLVIPAVNSSIASGNTYNYDPSPTLQEGTHRLYREAGDDKKYCTYLYFIILQAVVAIAVIFGLLKR